MTTEIIRYKISPTEAEAFERAYTHAESILQNSPHCLGYRLLRGHEKPENWILIIEWDSVEGHEQGFRQEPGFRKFFELVKPFFQQIQEMKHYDSRLATWHRSRRKGSENAA